MSFMESFLKKDIEDHKSVEINKRSQKAIEGLEPSLYFRHFYNISRIPRGTGNERHVQNYIKKFANERNLKWEQDEIGNVVVFVPPSDEKFADAPEICLQAHVDMVCEKNEGVDHDFLNDPIELVRKEDGFIWANGTTLGADDGAGVAAMLSLIEEKGVGHGKLNMIFTVHEEIGLKGASSIKKGICSGDYLLNLDGGRSLVIGCAGSKNTTYKYEFKWVDLKEKDEKLSFRMLFTGLKGGHSAGNIKDYGANSIKIFFRFVNFLKDNKFQFSLSSLDGGNKSNAIPREFKAIINISKESEEGLKKMVNRFMNECFDDYKVMEKLEIKISKVETSQKCFDHKFIEKMTRVVYVIPHGVFKLHHVYEGSVETSNNLASMKIVNDMIVIVLKYRTNVPKNVTEMKKQMEYLGEFTNATSVSSTEGYLGWNPDPNIKDEPTNIVNIAKGCYIEVHNKEPRIKITHGGLEAGILMNRLGIKQGLAFGPDIYDLHSPSERMRISSVAPYFEFLKTLIGKVSKLKKGKQ